MSWLEELAVAEFFHAAGGGAIITDDPRCFPFTHSLSPAPLRGGVRAVRLVHRWPEGGGWAEVTRSAGEVIAASSGSPILLDLSAPAEFRDSDALAAATLVRQCAGREPPEGFCRGSSALPGLSVRRNAEMKRLWERISLALSAPTLSSAELYDRLQAFVGGHGLVRDISFTEPDGPVAALDPAACLDGLSAGDAHALLSATGPQWPEAGSLRLRIPRFGDAPFRVHIAGHSRNGEAPDVTAEGKVSPVPLHGRGWAFSLAHEPAPTDRSFSVELTGEGVLVSHVSVCLPPLAAGRTAAADRYDPLSVYVGDWWPR